MFRSKMSKTSTINKYKIHPCTRYPICTKFRKSCCSAIAICSSDNVLCESTSTSGNIGIMRHALLLRACLVIAVQRPKFTSSKFHYIGDALFSEQLLRSAGSTCTKIQNIDFQQRCRRGVWQCKSLHYYCRVYAPHKLALGENGIHSPIDVLHKARVVVEQCVHELVEVAAENESSVAL